MRCNSDVLEIPFAEHTATTDPLTSLPNARSLFVQLDAELVLTLNSFGEDIVYEVPIAGVSITVPPDPPPQQSPAAAPTISRSRTCSMR